VIRLPSERRRVVVCSAAGVAALLLALVLGPWELAVLIGWIVTAALLVGDIWWEINGLDAEATRRVATREDDSRTAMRLLLVVACVVSLAAVVIGLHRAVGASVRLEVALSVGALLTVLLSWLLVHTLFMLRYAHLYYASGPGGVSFPGDAAPSYADFAYLAFTVGMTYQVADTDITSTLMRRALTRHALLSYLFGTAIVASSISVLAGLVV
jgi:uncharacterized membrane protein